MIAEDLGALLSPRSHPRLLARRRAGTIVALVRAFALLFTGLTLGWIAVDAVVFEPPVWMRLAIARVAAAGAFGALALACREPATEMRAAYRRLGALVAVPALFFVAAREIIGATPTDGIAHGVGLAYTFVPFVLAAAIAAFPLVLGEAAALAAFAFALQGWAALRQVAPALPLPAFDAFWLLFLIAGVGAFAALNQVRLLAALIRQATRDPLTGCLRRESGRELLDAQFQLSLRQGQPLAVLFADLDRFKAVNDAWGHEVGDEVLAAAASSLREASRESDAVLRWGGEEFVVVLPNTTAEDALRLVERLRARGPVPLPDKSPMTLSIGIAERIDDNAATAAALVDLADQRMYRAKQAGRNRCVHNWGQTPIELIHPETIGVRLQLS